MSRGNSPTSCWLGTASSGGGSVRLRFLLRLFWPLAARLSEFDVCPEMSTGALSPSGPGGPEGSHFLLPPALPPPEGGKEAAHAGTAEAL